ncbi:hypothetical protein PPL_11889 [Heterostelium album PN500]|uniref:Uncharacterized protein n=1 Tax=Heterostelium pallidum (strain ATCC 26659 / Pp 5 / PN500) TaxID=670386 RepID=D3BUR7_HETP5|nr:hypothetical protein PPL_11889 [Heterostelium album PN500]EFA74855.1 hypothetical protein PPL_11889 [Heterostelium album PN500]|eukprot:XP_020426989.1 hypothetical protein PPL_11889 [Heterostelium album PN500]
MNSFVRNHSIWNAEMSSSSTKVLAQYRKELKKDSFYQSTPLNVNCKESSTTTIKYTSLEYFEQQFECSLAYHNYCPPCHYRAVLFSLPIDFSLTMQIQSLDTQNSFHIPTLWWWWRPSVTSSTATHIRILQAHHNSTITNY